MSSVLSNWVALVFISGVTFFLSPYIVAKLGNTAYGIWALLMALTGYLGLLDLGVRSAVTRYVAKFHVQGDHVESGRVVSSALAVFGASGLLAVSISLGLAAFVHRLFQIPETYAEIAQLVLLIAGLNVAVSLVSGVFGGIVAGLQRFDLSNLIEILSTTCRAAAIVVALDSGKGLLGLALIQLSFSLGNLCAYVVVSRRLYPELRARPADCDRPHLKLIFSFSTYAFLLQISSFLIFYTDSVVIGAFLPVSAVTFFAIAGNLMNYTRSVLSGITTVIAPLASSLETATGLPAVRQTLLRGGRYATMVIAPIVLTFMLRGESFINLWMGPSYGELSGRVLWVLALAMLFAAGNYVAGATMIGTGRHKGLVPLALGEALANLVLSIILVQSWGVVGVAWGTALPDLAASFLFWPWYVRRTLNIRVREYVACIWLRPFGALLPFGLATYALETFWPAGNLLVFFLQVGALIPLALIAYWLGCLAPGERLALTARLPKRRRPDAMGTQ